jgi:GT2 family glycosyltransferase
METTPVIENKEAISPGVNAPDVSIILVCWNNKNYLDPCLKSLYECSLTSTFDVIVVDNGSNDGSQEMLREKYPDVIIIQNHKNEGLSKATNQGVLASTGKFILFLNNDTIVNGPSLNAMFDFMEQHPGTGAVGGKLLNEDGSFQGGYAKYSNIFEEVLIGTGLGDRIKPGYPSYLDSDQVMPAGWMSSANLLVRRAALDQVGLLDESYFIYGDEADLQYRMHKAGWELYYLPQATTLHYGGRSMNRWKRRKMVYRGKLLFYQKNYGSFQAFILRLVYGFMSLVKLVVWGAAYLAPKLRERAKLEIDSNLDVIKLCIHLQ